MKMFLPTPWLLLAALVVMTSPTLSPADAVTPSGDYAITLIAPPEGSELIEKRPLISCSIKPGFSPDAISVFLDGTDIKGAADLRADGFDYRPVTTLPSGAHTLSVTVTDGSGKVTQRDYTFSTRHTERYEQAYSDNEWTNVYETAMIGPEDPAVVPRSRLESNLSSRNQVKREGWTFGFSTNTRYLEQNAPVQLPFKRGVNVVDYLASLRYERKETESELDVGDVVINETDYTVRDLARRGGSLWYRQGGLHLSAFSVNGAQTFDFRDTAGLAGPAGAQVKGLTAGLNLFQDRLAVKAIHATGGMEEAVFGASTAPLRNRGSVTGFTARADIVPGTFILESEQDESDFDPDVSDEFPAEKDRAAKVKAGGAAGPWFYEALYEKIGTRYGAVGNPFLQRDKLGCQLMTGAGFQRHATTVTLSRHHDNVEQNPLLPTVYTDAGLLDYAYVGFDRLPLGVGYQKTMISSRDESLALFPLKKDGTTYSGRITLLREAWNAGLTTSYSVLNDRLQSDDSTAATYAATCSYFERDLTVAPSAIYTRTKFSLSGLQSSNYHFALLLRGDPYGSKVTYGFVGSWNRTKSSDGRDLDSRQAQARIGYLLSDELLGWMRPTAGFRAEYKRTNDQVAGNNEFILLFVLSSSILFSF